MLYTRPLLVRDPTGSEREYKVLVIDTEGIDAVDSTPVSKVRCYSSEARITS
jgi:tRNA (Thr-GGU) A37 N-methylase